PGIEKSEDSVAIIGMACKFPGSNNPVEFWGNLINGVNSISDLPEERKKDSLELLSDPMYSKYLLNMNIDDKDIDEGKIEFTRAGYLKEIDKFDADFFGITPAEAKFIEPAQRIFLEAAWEAIEDAGYGGKNIYGTKTAVFVGRDNTSGSIYRIFTEQDQMHLTGSWTGILASRLSYLFNLKGAAAVIDTACSSGAVAIHEACKAIRNRECDFAIAGGIQVNTQLSVKGQQTAMEMVESSDSKVRTFDRKANGTVWGEGVGALFLKPLKKAMEDGDNIYAVIKGSAVNNDGASNGITAPNAQAQEEVIVQAWKNAKVNPETISYIEAHGTGTVLGDPIEIKGLENAFSRFTDRKQFCGIGSVKTNIGHLVGTSGLASVIKVAMSLKNKMIPGIINFEESNPYIDFFDSPLYVNGFLRSWESESFPRRAGVSSFGFSGTNCHIVLEEAPEKARDESSNTSERILALTISARSENALKNYVSKYAEYIKRGILYDFRDICYTSNVGRGHYEYRIAIIARNLEDLQGKLSCMARNNFENLSTAWLYSGRHSLVTKGKRSLNLDKITEEQNSDLNIRAEKLLRNITSNNSDYENELKELCELYVMGAEVDWQRLYIGQHRRKVSLPVYPLERVRYWAPFRKISILRLDEKVSSQDNEKADKYSGSLPDVSIWGGENYSETEMKLSKIFANTLGMTEININDDLWDIGMNSLLFIRAQTLAEGLDVQIELSDIDTYSTIRELGLFLDRNNAAEKLEV
ncbi:MAG TPA: beta-ketoacyl synthase N-terminal-like domain-containing protein, partial [Clostridia bacterium]